MYFYIKAVEELNKAFNKLNKDYYDGKLPEVVITIQSGKNGKYYGWFWKNRWKNANQNANVETYHEINIGAEHLSRPIDNIISTLQHEMVHLYCEENEIKDTSNKNVYHNKRFKQEAEKRGLIIEQAKTIKIFVLL